MSPPFRTLLDSLPVGILTGDAAGRLTWGNEAAGDLVGVDLDKKVGRRIGLVMSVDFDLGEVLERVASTQSGYSNQEAVLTSRFNQTIDVGVTVAPMVAEDGSTIGVAVLIQDHSGLRRHVEHSRHAQRLRDLGEMSAMVAHEIKNPLGAIRGVSQVLKGECTTDDQREGLEVIRREVDRLTVLLDGVLGVARAEMAERHPVNIHRVLDRVVGLLRLEIGEGWREDRISWECDPSLPPVMGSEDQLVQLFFNLAKNAVDASPEGKPITFHTRVSAMRLVRGRAGGGGERMLVASVIDRGSGITEEARSRIFTPFFTTKREGTGLGLALCARIVQEHGGEIRLAEMDEGGTCAEVHLPFARKGVSVDGTA